MDKHLRILLLIAVVLSFNYASFAQGTNTGISGIVTDSSGEILIGASIVIKNEATGFSTGTVTGLNGTYSIRQLPLGTDYTITCSFVGFKSQRLTGYALNQGDQLKIDFSLEESTLLIDEITVTANPLAVTIEKM